MSYSIHADGYFTSKSKETRRCMHDAPAYVYIGLDVEP
jgi:hypothetical protein